MPGAYRHETRSASKFVIGPSEKKALIPALGADNSTLSRHRMCSHSESQEAPVVRNTKKEIVGNIRN